MRRVRAQIARAARTPPGRRGIALLDRLVSWPPGAFAVLTYHRVDEPRRRPWLYPSLLSATPSEFQNQMEMIGTRYQPVALPYLLAACRGERSLPPRCVLVTFDDAYRDFAENAWPVLRRLGIPAALFVPTGYPGQPDRAFWWDRLWQSVMETQLEAIETPLGLTDVSDMRQRPGLAVSLVEFHKTLPYEEAMQSVDDLCGQLGAGPSKSDVLSWTELRTLAAEGVYLASHSRNHPLLTQVSPAVQRAELEGSRADLAENVAGRFEAGAFAYPGGRHDEQSTDLLRELGFVIAFTTERGTNRLGRTDPMRLRRINVGSRSHSDLIRAQLAIGTFRGRTKGYEPRGCLAR